MFEDRYYEIDGLSLPSVTTILKIHNNPALNRWASNLGTELSEQISEETAEIGKQIHSYVAGFIKSIAIPILEWRQLSDEIKNGVRAYERFRLQTGFVGLAAEAIVYSLKYQYAGTLDAVGTIGDHRVLVDFKTGERFYPSMFAQVTAYYKAHCEMTENPRIKELLVVNLNRNTGVPDIHQVKHIQPYWNYFKACLRLFYAAKKIENGN